MKFTLIVDQHNGVLEGLTVDDLRDAVRLFDEKEVPRIHAMLKGNYKGIEGEALDGMTSLTVVKNLALAGQRDPSEDKFFNMLWLAQWYVWWWRNHFRMTFLEIEDLRLDIRSRGNKMPDVKITYGGPSGKGGLRLRGKDLDRGQSPQG